jgi:hypothetical protein
MACIYPFPMSQSILNGSSLYLSVCIAACTPLIRMPPPLPACDTTPAGHPKSDSGCCPCCPAPSLRAAAASLQASTSPNTQHCHSGWSLSWQQHSNLLPLGVVSTTVITWCVRQFVLLSAPPPPRPPHRPP